MAAQNTASRSMYEIRKNGECVTGIFATRDIQAGSIIMSERPLWTPYLHEAQPTAFVENGNVVAGKMFLALEPTKRDEIIPLLRLQSVLISNPMSTARLTRLCNRKEYDEIGFFVGALLAFRSRARPGTAGLRSVYNDVSWLNHSCQLSAECVFPDAEGDEMQVIAARNIPAGGEIFIHYTGPFATFEERKEHLLAFYDITCGCDLCTKIPEARDTNDHQRRELRAYQDMFLAFDESVIQDGILDSGDKFQKAEKTQSLQTGTDAIGMMTILAAFQKDATYFRLEAEVSTFTLLPTYIAATRAAYCFDLRDMEDWAGAEMSEALTLWKLEENGYKAYGPRLRSLWCTLFNSAWV